MLKICRYRWETKKKTLKSIYEAVADLGGGGDNRNNGNEYFHASLCDLAIAKKDRPNLFLN